jgi:hypothetical protein
MIVKLYQIVRSGNFDPTSRIPRRIVIEQLI